jgi:hypothetical protein
MKKITAEFELKTGKTKDDLGDIQDGLKGVEKGLDAAGKEGKKTNKILKGISNLFKGALGLGIVIKLFDVLKETFMQNQKVADTFATVMETLSLAFNDLFKFLDSNIGNIVGYFKAIFSDPKQAIVDFGVAIKKNLIERFNSALEVLGFLGTAIKKVFEGDFDGAMEAAKNAGKEYVDVLTGVDNSVDKIVEGTKEITSSIVEYGKSTYEAAAGVVELNKSAEVAAVINQGLIEKYDRQAEQQRQIRDDESKTTEERIAANTELGRILDEQSEKMLENVDLQIKAAQAEFDKNQNQENYIALLEAQNEREAVLAQIEGFRSEQLINRISLEREAADAKEEADEKEIDRLNKIEELLALEELNAYDALERDKQIALEELELLEGTEAEKQKILEHYAAKKKELDDESAEAEKQLDQDVMNAKMDMAQAGLGLIAEIAGEGSKVGKAAAIAQATIAGIQSTINAFQTANASPITTVFPAYPYIQAGLAAGFAGVSIAKMKSSPTSGGSGSMGSTAPAPPSFNVVGAAPENQLAQAIGEQEEKPIKAFVVSNEVTNAQALERNIVEGASIG